MATFTPYIGVGDLKFGMAQRDVAALIGSPKMVRKTPGEDSEMRGPDKPRVSIAAGRLVEISFLPAAGALILDGDDLFAGDGRQRLRRMQADYGPLFTHVGFVVSLEAGIAFTGICDGNTEQKAATVFERDQWARSADKLESISIT